MSYTIEQSLDIEAPQFASDSDKDYFMDQAKLFYTTTIYGDSYNLIVALRAAHDMTIRDLQQGAGLGGSGNIVSKTEGGQSISFNNSNYNVNSDAYLQLTRYGQKILSIKRNYLIGLRASGNDENIDDTCILCL